MRYIKNLFYKLYFILMGIAILLAVSAREGRFFGYSSNEIFEKYKSHKIVDFDISEAKDFFQGASKTNKVSDDEYQIFDADSKLIGTILKTMPICENIRGFGGNVPLVVALNEKNEIIGVSMKENSETPSFVERVKAAGLLEKWNGKTASEALSLEVDAVSGATMTSSAVIKSIRLRLSSSKNYEQHKQKLGFKEMLMETLAWSFLIVALLAYFPKTKLMKVRNYILGGAVIIPGFLLARFASLAMFNNIAKNGLSLETQTYIITLLILAFAIPLFTGKAFYCVWYCPFGAAQELVGKLLPKKLNLTGKFGAFLKKLRPYILIIISFLAIIGLKFSFEDIEPFAAFSFGSAPKSALIILAVMLFLSLFVPKPWCNYFCPTGQILECVRNNPIKPEQIKSIEIDKGEEHMKMSEVINLLLVIAIIILLAGQQQMQPMRQHHGQNAQISQEKTEKKTVENKVAETKASKDLAVANKVETEENNTDNKTTEKSSNTNDESKETSAIKESEAMVNETKTNVEAEKAVSAVDSVLQNIFSRKSVRTYADKPVEKEKLEMLVKAAMAAPTALNRQPWEFVILDKPEEAKELCNALPHAKYGSTAAIVVCGDKNIDVGEKFWIQDCSAATENLLLAVEAMGLGAVWTAVAPDEGRTAIVKEKLNLPDNILPLNVICVGYPAGEDKPKDKWKPERLHWGKY